MAALPLRGNARAQAMAAAARYNPNFDETNYSTRQQTRTAFSKGTQGQTLTSINMVLEHGAQLADAFAKIGNKNFPILNKANIALLGAQGKANATAFLTAKQAFATELAKALRGAGALNESEENAWLSRFSENMSPDQFKTAIQSAMHLLAARAQNLNSQYWSVMGANIPQFLSSKAAQTLKQFGMSPEDFDASYGGASAGGGATNMPNLGGWKVEAVD
jgi:hypothetical protein